MEEPKVEIIYENKKAGLNKKTIDLVVIGLALVLLVFGGIFLYGMFEYNKELRSNPCQLCQEQGFICYYSFNPYDVNLSDK